MVRDALERWKKQSIKEMSGFGFLDRGPLSIQPVPSLTKTRKGRVDEIQRTSPFRITVPIYFYSRRGQQAQQISVSAW